MEQLQCKQTLARLMAVESHALNELSGLLEREHGFLEANNIVALDEASRERQRCVARIFRVDEERRALCRDQGYALTLEGLEQLIRWCDPNGTLAAGWATCSAAAARCRQLNDRNGALVSARLQHVQARLGTLIDGRRETVTYGPKGAYSPASQGRVVTTEA
jgi:flagellar biosynthesis protein FlgN